jgi:hypothetical protein
MWACGQITAFRSGTLPPSLAPKKKAACSSDVSRLSTQEATLRYNLAEQNRWCTLIFLLVSFLGHLGHLGHFPLCKGGQSL